VTQAFAHRPTTLREYLAILRRRKWLIVALPVIAASAAYAIAARDAPVYRAQSQVLVNRSTGVSTQVTGSPDPTIYDSTRYLATQANVARTPQLAARVATAARVPGLTAGGVLGASNVTAKPDADVLKFTVTYGEAVAAAAIANAYAQEFTQYKSQVDTAQIKEALRVLRARMAKLRDKSSATYQTLFQYATQLLTAQKLVTNNSHVLATAGAASQISPHPRRNLILGGLLGLLLAVGLVLFAEALDRRVRSEDEVGAVLGVPILGRIPAPPRKLNNGNGLVMLAEPMSIRAETFRKLRTSLEFVNRDRRARTIMFTSGVQGEGKSTTVANLAVAFARAGRNVALVDLDIRRPSLHSFLGVRNDRGIADVVSKRVALDHAIQHVALPAPASPVLVGANNRMPPASSARWAPSEAAADSGSNGRSGPQHFLHFLACGPIPPVDGEFLGDQRVAVILSALGETFDIVLVDAPPFLAVGDAMALSANVDAIVVVTHLGTHRPILRELARELHQSGARSLGFVLTGVSGADGHGYGYGYGYGYDHGDERDQHEEAEAGAGGGQHSTGQVR
jgi:succinoglycan biosynthesis transport protein ExoP